MDFYLAEMVSGYCDLMLGDAETQKVNKNKKDGDIRPPKSKRKKKKKDKEICKLKEDAPPKINIGHEACKVSGDKKKAKDSLGTKPNVADDGFKIVSAIPANDSDIIDAFESGYEDKWDPQVLNDTKSKNTELQEKVDIGVLKVKKKKKKDDGVCKMEENCHFNVNNDVADRITGDEREVKKDFCNIKPKITDDGFKIISDIPPDDSDISDAFESDIEADWDVQVLKDMKLGPGDSQKDSRLGNTNEGKVTEDGFKIVSSIPIDDSDVSDAFESDIEDEYQGSADRLHQQSDGRDINDGDMEHKIVVADDVAVKIKSKKALQGMIDDFDLGAVLQKKKNSGTHPEQAGLTPNMKPTGTLAERRKITSPIQILDFSKKRGTGSNKRKLSVDKPAPTRVDINTDVTDVVADETTMKKTRFEVFKFGMSGFDKMKKKETKEALAIRLGAKPQKNKNIPYKQLMKMKKEEKMKVRDERDMQRKLGYEVKKIRKNKRRDPNKVAGFNPQIGKFLGGVQVINKKDLAKIKGTKL
ncbi:uncharacterized protein LOC143023949 isoform X2 [Oratosquilla oratoria]|uniref:uncharacterized protein LOC143023949 isoform X2 n=1 Tax=Oratosquilla oratoria TaxID=337810 RepID=UPI003F763987